MYRLSAPCLIAALLAFTTVSAADEETLPPPPPPTAPDSIIPSGPPPTADTPLEPPPTAPDRLAPTGSLAPEDIPNPPTIAPTPPETPDTTEPGSPAPESPSKKAEAPPEKKAGLENPPPPPPIEAETEIKPDKDLDKLLDEKKDEKKEDMVEIPLPTPLEATPPPTAFTREEPREPAPKLSITERARLRHIPAYQKIKPSWAFQFSYSPGALGNGDIADAPEGAKATGEILSVEYQPPFLQDVGVFGLGPTLAVYPVSGDFNVTNSTGSIWSVGVQGRYQARFFREQPIVPVVGFAWERLTYHLHGLGPAGNSRDAVSSIDMTGPFFGVWFLLNIVEPNQAASAYINSGLVRSYLTAELRSMSGSDDDVDVSGNSYFIGIRVEF